MPEQIQRRPRVAAQKAHDLVVVGGGIQGTFVALEAARRGLRPLLLERGDFGHGTSWSSLRILHGGLRYLQSADLPRFFGSVAERRWFARTVPQLCRPLPCLMPLYEDGLRRPAVLRAALTANHVLSLHRNRGVPEQLKLRRGGVLDVRETLRRFPEVRRQGLQGGALWYDVLMPSTERVLIELLRWAVAEGATALNYVEAVGLRSKNGRIIGVHAVDRETGSRLRVASPVVINCAGPWAAEVVEGLRPPTVRDLPLTLAFNLLVKDRPLSDCAVAVESPRSGHTYFLLPWHGRIFAGTYYTAPLAALPGPHPYPTQADIREMLADLKTAIPERSWRAEQVQRVYPGVLPARGPAEAAPASRDLVIDHGGLGGPEGLYTAVGVKYTTARRLATRVINAALGGRPGPLRPSKARPAIREKALAVSPSPEVLSAIVQEESVLHLDDLLLRRMHWLGDETTLQSALDAAGSFLDWGEERSRAELDRLRRVGEKASHDPPASVEG